MDDPDRELIRDYYDAEVPEKVRAFVDGNRRLDVAWKFVLDSVASPPGHVLEIGCGIGSFAWRCHRRWPSASILGIDLSVESIRVADRLFGSSRLTFAQSELRDVESAARFDLILLIDVFEHVARSEREPFLAELDRLLAKDGSIIINSPTPGLQHWLRGHEPAKIQPVDLDIDVADILDVATAVNGRILRYHEASVWHDFDYLQALVTRGYGFQPSRLRARARRRMARTLWNVVPARGAPARRSRARRVARRLDYPQCPVDE